MNITETNPDDVSPKNEAQPQTPQVPQSGRLFALLAVAALLLGFVIFRGIHQRVLAESNLGTATERAAIATVNVPPVPRMELENWLWKTHKIRIRGAEPNKLRLSTPYYLQKKDIDRFLEKFDAYKRMKNA